MREAIVTANVLVRLVIDEPRELADRAEAIFEAAERHKAAPVVTGSTPT